MQKIILIVLLISFYTTKAQTGDDKICGSIEKYKQTYEWRDLPGCISDYREEGDESQTTAGLLAYAKMQFKKFYERWDGNMQLNTDDPIQTYVTACNFFKDPSAKEKWDSDPALKAAAPLFEEQAKKVEAAYDIFYFKWKDIVEILNQNYIYAEMYMTEVEKSFENAKGKTMYGLIGDGERAVLRSSMLSAKEMIQKAKELNVPDGLVILGTGEILPTTVGQIKDVYIRKWEVYSKESDQKAAEAYEAELAPYLKLLSGEKAKEFRDWYGLIIYGPGGKELKTPQEVAGARAWYSSGSALCTICPRWKVTGVHFNGNSIARRSRDEGYGSSSPYSAFK